MQGTTRRKLLGAAGGLLAAPSVLRSAHAAQFNWRLGHTAPVEFALHQYLTAAAEEVAQKSGGRIEIKIFPDSQLGAQVGLANQIRNSQLEMGVLSGQILTTVQALASMPMIGFAFPGYDALWKALDGELGQMIREQMQLRTGIVMLDRCWDFGFRILTTSKQPVRTAADLKGLRIRTPVEPEFVALFQALQASPVAMGLGEAYGALQQGVVDGQEGLLPLVVAAHFEEVQKYCALTNHSWDGQWICTSANAWKGLPDPLRKVVGDAFNAAGLKQRAENAEITRKVQAALADYGMQFNTVDPASFRDTLRQSGYYADLKKKLGDKYWDVLEKYTGKLA